MRTNLLGSQLLQATLMFLALAALSYIVFPLLPISLNFVLAALIAGSFFLTEARVYALYGIALLLWLKYTPSVSAELIYIAGAGGIAYLIVKLFVLKRSFFAALLLFACFHTIFWAIFFTGQFATSVYFYLAFLYTSALLVVLYALHIWVQKISHWRRR